MIPASEIEKSIIIIGDEKNIVLSFADYFEDRDWAVVIAESGEAALKELKNSPCDAAIVDIRMTGMGMERFSSAKHMKCILK